ncbi:MAG: tRNA (adenosine(37)-N6)-dimethylallyltransferase MiaA [Pseudomonadota bacterium]
MAEHKHQIAEGPLVVVTGPTASGKSGLALALARRFDGTVINSDALQVYRELEILTARPNPEALSAAPHRLYGVLPGAQACSAALWRDLALAEIAAAQQAGRLPIVTGGTGLYIRALLRGLASLPEIPDQVRQAARARFEERGLEAFRAELAARDPAAGRLADRQRLIRAWEVLEATGRPLSAWQAEPAPAPAAFRALGLVLLPPRAALTAACDGRFEAMIGAGALDEVRALSALGLAPDRPILKALGVPELCRHLAGEIGLAEAVAAAQSATRRYAKRQATWLRGQTPKDFPAPPHVIGAQYSESLDARIFKIVDEFLLTAPR